MFTASQGETPSKIIMAQVPCENVDNIPRITPHVFEVGLNEISLTFVDISQWT